MQRPYDLAARYGGEEFVLLLQRGDGLGDVLERVRAEVEALAIPHEASGTAPHLTASCGGILADAETAGDPERLLSLCDEALYRAKRDGRNRVAIHAGPA